ncbi:MAG: helix-turn-helix transcriptional regulator [Prevotella sp.]|nr:helix-turn-helix transcriptional regulator [Prevotella sp.]
MERTKLSAVVKTLRKEYGLTQEDLALKSGVGLCFVRNLEQGKTTLRMDKVNQLLDLFDYELAATPKQ